MYLLLFTIMYVAITQILNVDGLLALGIYIIGLGFVKGMLSEEIKDIQNFRKTKLLYNRIGTELDSKIL